MEGSSTFKSLSFRDPGYPIYKAFIVPYRDGDKNIDVRRVTEEDVKDWCEVIKKLREFIQKYFEATRVDVKSLTLHDKLSLIADLIVVFFRIPLVREPLPQVVPNPIKIYLFLRSNCNTEKEMKLIRTAAIRPDDLSGVEQIWSSLKKFLETDFVRLLDDPEVSELVEKAWYVFPADTRPCLNMSALIPHLLLTSTIAWSLSINKKLGEDKAALVRFLALVHDIGKLLDPIRHYEAGVNLVKLLLQGIISDEELNKIVYFVEKHHVGTGTPESEILRKADHYASAADRLAELAVKIVWDKVKEAALEAGVELPGKYLDLDWEFWRRLYEANDRLREKGIVENDVIEELSRMFVRELRESSPQPLTAIGIENVEFAMFDIGGIQSYIARASKLPVTVAASYTVDFLVVVAIPILSQIEVKLREGIWLPYESFLLTAGGIDYIIIPEKFRNHLENVKNMLQGKYRELPIRMASTRLKTYYPAVSESVAPLITLEKFSVGDEIRDVDKGYIQSGALRLCEYCSLSPGKHRGDVGQMLCDECYSLLSLGWRFHFKARWDSEFEVGNLRISPCEVFDMGWDDVKKYIVEVIAGHDRKELEDLLDGRIERRNLSLIKLDGNLMGAFMASAISFSDMLERSSRIDLALKKAYDRALHALWEGVREASGGSDMEAAKSVLAVKLGTLYMGGDDSLILMPSWASLPFALILGREFAMNMGRIRSLSIGVVAASPQHDIWLLIEAADSLMEEAKIEGRRKENIGVGTICFDIVESGLMSRTSAVERLESLRSFKLSAQPLLIEGSSRPSLASLLENMVGVQPENYKGLFKEAYLTSRFEGKAKEKLKDIRRVVSEVIVASRSLSGPHQTPGFIVKISEVYCWRQRQRLGEAGDSEKIFPYIVALNSLEWVSRVKSSTLADIDRAGKILSGGVI